MEWMIIVFILAAIALFWIISKNFQWTKRPCDVNIPLDKVKKMLKTPEPLFSSPVINEPWYTKQVKIKWSCDFSPLKTVYNPEQVSFRVNTVMGTYNNVEIYNSADSLIDISGFVYTYEIIKRTKTKFKTGTYNIYVSSFVDDNTINPNSFVKIDHKTSSTSLLKIVVGDCKPMCRGRECGTSNCGVKDGCGNCEEGYECNNGKCVCVPDCTNKSCGDNDGCGGKCDGICPDGSECINGICQPTKPCSVDGSPCEGPEGAPPGTFYCNNGKCISCPRCGGDECPDACTYCSKNPCVSGYSCVDGKCKKCPKCGDCSPGCDDCVANCTGDTDTCVNGKCKCGSGKRCTGNTDTCVNGKCQCGTTGVACNSNQKCINGQCKNVCCEVGIIDPGYKCWDGKAPCTIHKYTCSPCDSTP